MERMMTWNERQELLEQQRSNELWQKWQKQFDNFNEVNKNEVYLFIVRNDNGCESLDIPCVA